MDDPKVSDLNLKLGLRALMDNVEFVEPRQLDSNRSRCAHCEEEIVFYYVGGCEHKPLVCSNCFENLGRQTCRHCEQTIENVCREDSQFLDLKVYCPLKKDGCEVVIPLKNILEHQEECHPSVDPIKQVTNTAVKSLNSTGSFKQQTKEDDVELRKIIEDIRKKVNDNEKSTRESRIVEKLTNQLALLEEKVNREIAEKKDMEKRLLDQTKRKSDVVKQELLRHFSDQSKQQLGKQMKDLEIKVSNQSSASLEKLKQEVLKAVTVQVNKQVEMQVHESRKKIVEQLVPSTDAKIQKLSNMLTDRMEMQLKDSEKKLFEIVHKKGFGTIRIPSYTQTPKSITVQVTQQTEKKSDKSMLKTTSEISKKTVLATSAHSQLVKNSKRLHVEQKADEMLKIIGHHTNEEVHESRATMNESDQEAEILKKNEEKIADQMGDVTDGQKQERFLKLANQLTKQVENLSLETQNKVLDELRAKSKDVSAKMERYVLEQVGHATDKQTQGIQKRCDTLVSEQMKKGMSEIQEYVTKSIGLEFGKQVAELQKMFAKELKIQKQQLEQSNQQFLHQLSESQDNACIELKKIAEKEKEDFQKLIEAKFNSQFKNHTAELQKRLVEELKVLKQDLFTTNQKHVSQLQEMHDAVRKQISKKNEVDKDKMLRSVDERVVQQSKVNETEFQKRIAKEIKLQKLELVQENKLIATQLRDNQENVLKQYNKKVELDKEKWMKYFEERLNQQIKSHLNSLNMQMLQDKQELLQANQQSLNQMMGLQETSSSKFSKKMESQKQGILSDFKNQVFEHLEKKITSFQNEMSITSEASPRSQEDINAMHNDLMQHVDKRVQDAREQLAKGLQEVREGLLLLEKNPARNAEITEVDGPGFKKAIISEIENRVFDKFQRLIDSQYENRSPFEVVATSASPADGDGYINGKEARIQNSDGAVNGNSAVHEDRVDYARNSDESSARDLSHFEHFEALQTKIFNKQFGKLVNEAHTKIMAVVDELSSPQREEIVTEVALRVNERLADMQKVLLSRIDEESQIQKHEVLKYLDERLGIVQEEFGKNVAVEKEVSSNQLWITENTTMVEIVDQNPIQVGQTTPLKEWHEENSKLVQLTQGNLVNNLDRKEEIRRLIKEELTSSSMGEESSVESHDMVTTYVWRITNFRKKFENFKTGQSKRMASNEFTVQGASLKLKVHFMKSQLTHWLSLAMGFVKMDNLEESPAKSMYSQRRTFVLVDQSQASHRRDRVIVREPGFRDEGIEKWMATFSGPVCFTPVEALEEGSIYVKNDTVIIKIILEPIHTLYRTMRNDDGVLFWKIDDYGMKKLAEVYGLVECLYSDYFSTSPKGYRMQIRAYLNGDNQGKSEHLSIYLYFRRGQYDEFIASTFPHKVTFTVLDQTESSNRKDISKTMESDGHIVSAYGFREFALQSEIEMPEYLKNDTLLIKVEVVPLVESRLTTSSRNSILFD